MLRITFIAACASVTSAVPVRGDAIEARLAKLEAKVKALDFTPWMDDTLFMDDFAKLPVPNEDKDKDKIPDYTAAGAIPGMSSSASDAFHEKRQAQRDGRTEALAPFAPDWRPGDPLPGAPLAHHMVSPK